MPRTTVPPLAIPIRGSDDVARASLDARVFAQECGVTIEDQARIATVAAELASNISKYAGRGRIMLVHRQVAGGECIDVEARDSGPGIPSVDDAMRDHLSTGGTLGLGLPGVRRMVDEFDIHSEVGVGTRVRTRRWVVQPS